MNIEKEEVGSGHLVLGLVVQGGRTAGETGVMHRSRQCSNLCRRGALACPQELNESCPNLRGTFVTI
ncbi:hypothetical protein E2C01_054301 [Portunus trituberculatus]|uniref:Uncharacterized protein n=1 Tax=Portunus trituberculatus TaxID=210409 RepID=A0A5B7GN36_PORTR|nr:hypothetical protein [Portunus trituberculatus]